jgi:hypothetical protein
VEVVGRKGVVLVVLIAAVTVMSALNQETGPPPELEAGHSAEEAIAACLDEIEVRYSEQSGRVVGLLQADNLKGGEYVVRGEMSLWTDRRPATVTVRCEPQFRVDEGWTIEHVETGS